MLLQDCISVKFKICLVLSALWKQLPGLYELYSHTVFFKLETFGCFVTNLGYKIIRAC